MADRNFYPYYKNMQRSLKHKIIPQHLIIKFLESVKQKECLWKIKTDDSKNSFKKEIAYLDVIRDVGMPNLTIQDVKHNIASKKASYRSLRKQVLDRIKLKMNKPKLPFWYDLADSFLRDPDPKCGPQNQLEYIEPFVINRSNTTYGTPSQSATTRPTKVLTTESATSGEEDEFDLFGKSVAVQLEKMPFETAITLQLKLQALVTKHRLTNAMKATDTRAHIMESRPVDESIHNIDAPTTSSTITTITFPDINMTSIQEGSNFEEFLNSMEMFIKEENDPLL